MRTVAADPPPSELGQEWAAPVHRLAAVYVWQAHAVWSYVQSVRMAVAIVEAAPPRRDRGAGEADIASTAGAVEPGTGRCGGDLPPCSVMWCESKGDPRAENPTSSASGLWQILDSTWAGFGGYAHAADAPVSVQNEKARLIYDGGAGRSQWSC